jgi:hypothetical protein
MGCPPKVGSRQANLKHNESADVRTQLSLWDTLTRRSHGLQSPAIWPQLLLAADR